MMTPPRWTQGLTGRIVGLFLGLLLVVQVASVWTLHHGVETNARLALAGDLAEGKRLLQRLLAQNTERLRQGAALLAADYAFRSAVQSDDVDTIRSALDNHGARIGASVSALLTPDLRLRALSGGLRPQDLAPLLARLPVAAAGGARAAGPASPQPADSPVLLVEQQAVQLVLVPMKAPLLVGWVVMGFPLGDELPADLHALTQLKMALVARSGEQPARVLLPRLPPAERERMAQLPAGPGELSLAGDTLKHDSLALGQGSGWQVQAVLWRSVDEAVAPYQRLQLLLLVISLGGVAVFAAGSVFTARRITQPVRALVSASNRLGAGDFDTPVPQPGRSDEIGRLAQSFETMRLDIGRQNRAIHDLAYRDTLTGLPNRALFSQVLNEALTRHDCVSVLMLDLDRLKQVNDKLGYHMGDRLLVQVGQRLVALPDCRNGFIARLSGDEFAVMLPQCPADAAAGMAAAVLAMLDQPLLLGDSLVDLAGAIGVATWPDHAADAASLLTRTEVAMYEAKHRRIGVLVYDPAIDSDSAQTLSLLGEMRRALQRDELRLFLQPKLDVAGRHLIGAEALVRWQHPERGLVPPLQFIPFAEETGFIHELTLWVVQDAARVWAEWRERGLDLRLSVNLSTHDLMKADLLERLQARLDRHQVPPRALCLEITESAIMSDPQRALQTLQALSAAGYKLSIDDFGTGYSSYATLKHLPVHELKIDMSFVRAMEKEPKDAMIVRSIIEVAHNLGLSVVAEGVENLAILDQLDALHCDEAQGWHIGKPMPTPQFLAWAEQRWPGLLDAPAAAPLQRCTACGAAEATTTAAAEAGG